MKLLHLGALVAIAAFALMIAFSPGLAVLIALTLILATVAETNAVPWLKSSLTTTNFLTEHGHLRAVGLGAGGGHNPPHSIVAFILAVWAVAAAISRRVGHGLSLRLIGTAGQTPASSNLAAQPLPS